MIHKNQQRGFYFFAWDVETGAPKTGDASNITIYISQDGGSPSSQGSPTEIDESIMPGWYYKELTLTGNSAAVAAISSTSRVQVVLSGVYCNTGAIPSASAGSSGGLPIIGSAPLSYLDAAVSSRAAPGDAMTLTSAYDRAKNALSHTEYVAPDNTSIADIKAKTDQLSFTGGDVKATLDGEQVTVGGYATGQSPQEALTAQGYTSARASNLDYLDATISSRLADSSFIPPDNAGIAAIKAQTDQLSFVGSDVKATLDGEKVTVQTNEDKTGYSLTSAYDRAKDALSYTEYTAPDNTTIQAIKTSMDTNLDAKVSTRLAAADYVAPDNTSIGAIKSQTDKLTFNVENAVYAYGTGGGVSGETDWTETERKQIRYRLGIDGETSTPSATPNLPVTAQTVNDKTGYSLTSDYDRAKNALSYSEYTAPDNTSIAAIKAKTDNLSFTGNDVKATLDGEKVTVQTNEDKTGYSLTSAYDRAKNALGYDEYTPVEVVVTPIEGRVIPTAKSGGKIEQWQDTRFQVLFAITDQDLTGTTITLSYFAPSIEEPVTIPNTYITITPQDDGCLVAVDAPDDYTPTPGRFQYILKDESNDVVLLYGDLMIHANPAG